MFKNKIANFTTKSGKEIELNLPTLEAVPALLEFVNRLTDEDTFLSLTGKHKTYEEEEAWIKNIITSMKAKQSVVIWATYNHKLVGECSLNRGSTRDPHVGKLGVMVDRDFRQDGIGRAMLEYILEQAKKLDIKFVTLDIFSDNLVAFSIYEKLGFKEYGRLPNGLIRRGKYSDLILMYKDVTTHDPSLGSRGND